MSWHKVESITFLQLTCPFVQMEEVFHTERAGMALVLAFFLPQSLGCVPGRSSGHRNHSSPPKLLWPRLVR